MDTSELDYQEEENRRKGAIGSAIVHVLFFLMLLYSALQLPDPAPREEGILISFGALDQGMGEPNPNLLASASDEIEPPYETSEPEPIVEPEASEPEEVPEEVEPEPKPERTEKAVAKKQEKVLETEDPEAIQLKKEKEDKKKKERREKEAKKKEAAKKKKKADAKKKKEADKKKAAEKAAAKKIADAKAKKEAAAAAAAKKKADAKQNIDALFGGGGDGNKPGNNGNDGSDPDPGKLDGISTGTGVIGGGLGNRGGSGPAINDSSQATGVVVIKVCIGDDGKVVSAKYTQGGSSTTNSTLIKIATANAKKYSFKKGDADKQCGTITYDFKVK